MPFKRTPPSTPGATEEDATNNKLRYNKRPRTESSSPRNSEFAAFKIEMRGMFESIKSEQNILLQKLVEDVHVIKVQNNNIQKTNIEIERSIETIKGNYEDLKTKFVKLERDRLECYNYINKLEKRIEDLEFGSRSSSIELRNIPSNENESADDIVKHILNVGKALNLVINHSNIRDAYRLPAKPGRNKTIVADFDTVLIKNKFLTSARSYNRNKEPGLKLNSNQIGLKGQIHPIYVSEYLPGNSRRLFYQARAFANQNGYKFCWTSNRRIFLREEEAGKRIKITSEEDLASLQSS